MKVTEIPLVSAIVESGADDRVYDGLLLAGAVIILCIAVLNATVGHSAVVDIVSKLLAIAYVAAFVAYALYRGVRER